MKTTAKTPEWQAREQAPQRVLILNGTKAWCDAVSRRIPPTLSSLLSSFSRCPRCNQPWPDGAERTRKARV